MKLRRTEITDSLQNSKNKWNIIFTDYKVSSVTGDEYECGVIESGYVFDTEDAAYDAGQRALKLLEETGRFPNMCEPF
jgi:hypothetical protein